MTPNRQDQEPRLSGYDRREDFPARRYFEQPRVHPPDTKAFDRSPLVGWLAISGLTVALGVVGYFVFVGGPGPSSQTDSEFRASGEALVLPQSDRSQSGRSQSDRSQSGQSTASPPSDRQSASVRPKSISSGTGPLEAPIEALAETSSANQESTARAEIAVVTPQQVILPPPEAMVLPPEEAPRLTASPSELAHLLGLADAAMSRGDIAVARDFYETAYDSGSAEAATAMARTYDPLFLQEIAALGVKPDPDAAVDWYRRGEEEGDPRARQHLDSLMLWLRQAGQGGAN